MSKRRFGDKFGLVYLSGEEIRELKVKYPNDYAKCINQLDEELQAGLILCCTDFEELKKRLTTNNQAADELEEIPEDKILEVLRFNYHNVHCNKCGKRMEFLEFVEKVEGKRPDGRYKCECGITAEEKEGVLIYGDNDARH